MVKQHIKWHSLMIAAFSFVFVFDPCQRNTYILHTIEIDRPSYH